MAHVRRFGVIVKSPIEPADGETRARFHDAPAPLRLLFLRRRRVSAVIERRFAAGLVGQTFALAGLQRWSSLIAGAAILLAASSRYAVGTLPMMLGIGLVGEKLCIVSRWKVQKLVPLCLVVLGVLLILRGMSLGIPCVSPDLAARPGPGSTCH